MAGWIRIIGLGPGSDGLLTPDALRWLELATDVVGYHPYVSRVPARPGLSLHPSDNREELVRARHALSMAQAGRYVAVVSGGDAGVFGMASAVFEAVESGDPAWAGLDIEVVPGISACLAAAARAGAPLGHDFCVLSLSDNLKPWDLLLHRLRAAAEAGFAMALYNPVSAARPWQLDEAFDVLRALLPGEVPVIFARAVTRPDEKLLVCPLREAKAALADMRTLVLICTEATRLIAKSSDECWVYAPRSVTRS
ncbi:precorrin-3B C(17)-methyltransferase [Granulibacter bethesdensis]|uniref:Precorrin-3B C17-methyltransferase n=1 Tax=Granulibacter bethesdensis (strain ATCC BAA-1260 / CGDNIH1) TaxID=391165 RepID=Q0BUE2_GRABC|nr:precorrin-3B C(17)-methyltransferase [Granulibacter bethesdensis]ABI61560.1 Precorrin-3B C17-methyltransferase [Granulibacter bethesdensis CGDNIH1]APH51359.1 Precorrin-3B C17-methyltransferase [Granulibacter bethesdensis]APH64052.1 Precorrin-3B C17-methyltransferase [Granulibacter bethesdensis]